MYRPAGWGDSCRVSEWSEFATTVSPTRTTTRPWVGSIVIGCSAVGSRTCRAMAVSSGCSNVTARTEVLGTYSAPTGRDGHLCRLSAAEVVRAYDHHEQQGARDEREELRVQQPPCPAVSASGQLADLADDDVHLLSSGLVGRRLIGRRLLSHSQLGRHLLVRQFAVRGPAERWSIAVGRDGVLARGSSYRLVRPSPE